MRQLLGAFDAVDLAVAAAGAACVVLLVWAWVRFSGQLVVAQAEHLLAAHARSRP